MAREKIGILGGTFDPIHEGHIRMALAAVKNGGVDRVLVLPTGNPPHKTNISPAEDRWRMVCAALVPYLRLEPCRLELEREGVIYTVDTLRRLRDLYPKADLYYLIGADTLMELRHWRSYEEVLQLCTFLICPRPWDQTPAEMTAERKRLEGLGGRFRTLPMEPIDISSTEIRRAIADGRAIDGLPAVCREYALLAGLYGMKPRCPNAEARLGRLFGSLNIKRFAHSLGVALTARHLALVHGEDPDKAEIAGILHDCAKCMPVAEMRRICREEDISDDPSLLASGALMHGPVGAWAAARNYGVCDPAVLRSIARHTTGCAGMTRLDMCVYLADKIEPCRADYPALTEVRILAQLSLEKAMLMSMERTADYVRDGRRLVHPATLETIAWLRTLPGTR